MWVFFLPSSMQLQKKKTKYKVNFETSKINSREDILAISQSREFTLIIIWWCFKIRIIVWFFVWRYFVYYLVLALARTSRDCSFLRISLTWLYSPLLGKKSYCFFYVLLLTYNFLFEFHEIFFCFKKIIRTYLRYNFSIEFLFDNEIQS